ncbi:hypothetical protein NOS3756_35660 [Nostoc sp. NIES-3756]|uniref:hypothetical protein n=1 Tax=Nostoc sp. NIES-3756 TaxID=1751286 RepID=UPI00071FFE1F|nr:hypothetical protein [Nostoc sp. NIES-3756]BAT54594.1 hypothetical protein NOS3756_35660 [Nostoc sp. NIES-3756]BAY37843.1 hypothetical protein NIES2111_21840 [Nostoc sp. NIES-2111]
MLASQLSIQSLQLYRLTVDYPTKFPRIGLFFQKIVWGMERAGRCGSPSLRDTAHSLLSRSGTARYQPGEGGVTYPQPLLGGEQGNKGGGEITMDYALMTK